MGAAPRPPWAHSSPRRSPEGSQGKTPSRPCGSAAHGLSKHAVTVLAARAQAGLAHPAVGPLAGVVVPLAIGVEVRAVLAPAQPVPVPVVRLAWLPIPAGRGPQPAGRVGGHPGGPGTRGEAQTLEEQELKGAEGHRKLGAHSLEVGLVVRPVHPFPDAFRVTEAHPGV